MLKTMLKLYECAFPNRTRCESIELDNDAWKRVFDISKKHDLAHIVSYALDESNNAIDEPLKKEFDQARKTAIFRYIKACNEIDAISKLFCDKEIPFIPLKGLVLANYYKEPWLRTSCDIDILIKEEDIEKATRALSENLAYTVNSKGQYDISTVSPSGVHVELHYKLIEADFYIAQDLQQIWCSNEIFQKSSCQYAMTNEMFLLYHIYHMAKHFLHGGCGIRSFIDLWIIKNSLGYDETRATSLLKNNQLYEFYEKAIELTEVWFDSRERTPLIKEIESYVLSGGVYGSLEQNAAMFQVRRGGRFQHIIRRIFIPYKSMVFYYPSLKKCPILFPFYQIRRWFRILFCGGRKRAYNEIVANSNLSNDKKLRAQLLLKELKLTEFAKN